METPWPMFPSSIAPPGGLELVQRSLVTCRWPVVAGAVEILAPGCGSVEGALDKQPGYSDTLGTSQENSPLKPPVFPSLAWNR